MSSDRGYKSLKSTLLYLSKSKLVLLLFCLVVSLFTVISLYRPDNIRNIPISYYSISNNTQDSVTVTVEVDEEDVYSSLITFDILDSYIFSDVEEHESEYIKVRVHSGSVDYLELHIKNRNRGIPNSKYIK